MCYSKFIDTFMNKKKGFSLLELLVTVGIIAILLAIGVTSYSTVQKKSRDAKRRGDLRTIQQALEQYYSTCGNTYQVPPISAEIVCNSPTLLILPTNQIPFDPKTGSSYGCGGTCNGSQFTLCATPEIENQICVSNQQ